MIFAASLAAPIKKAYGEKAMATTVQNIISQMNLDPKLSQMDACVLGVKDVKGINRAKVQAALRTKHPDVCVIYIYSSDKEGELIDAPFKELLKKISADSMRSVIDKFLESRMCVQLRSQLLSVRWQLHRLREKKRAGECLEPPLRVKL